MNNQIDLEELNNNFKELEKLIGKGGSITKPFPFTLSTSVDFYEFFNKIDKAKTSYIYQTNKFPTHILISNQMRKELHIHSAQNKGVFVYDTFKHTEEIMGLKVVPTELSVLQGDIENFILLTDLTIK